MNNAILWFASQTAYRAQSKIRQLWDGGQASKVVVVLHRSDGGKLTEDTGRKFRRKGMSPAVLDVDLEVTLPSLSVLLLAACTKPLYIALLIYKLGPPKTCFEASLPLPVGSREKQSWGEVGVIALLWVGFCALSLCWLQTRFRGAQGWRTGSGGNDRWCVTEQRSQD